MKYQLSLTTLILISVLTGCLHISRKSSDDTVKVDATRDTHHANAKITKYGLFKTVKKGTLLNNQDTGTGKSISKPTIELVKQTKRIPIKQGNTLAYQYRIYDLPKNVRKIQLRRLISHPEMIKPDGEKISGSDRTIFKPVKKGEVFALDGYTLSEEYEMVPGEWTFQLWHKNQLLLEQQFTTYLP